MDEIEELCLSGASNRGVCYIGVLQFLKEKGLLRSLKRILGVSIGSLIGLSYIVGYSAKELLDILFKTDVSSFEDVSVNTLTKGSVLQGKVYREWVWGILKRKVDPMITFEILYEKFSIDFIVGAVELNKKEDPFTLFSKDETPDMPVYYAVIASMSIPFIFPPVAYNGNLYVDAVIINNLPNEYLSEKAVGVRVTSKMHYGDPSSILSYVGHILQVMTTQMRKLKQHRREEILVCADDFDNLNFNLSNDDILTLYFRGYEETGKWYQEKTECMEKNTESTEEIIIDHHVRENTVPSVDVP